MDIEGAELEALKGAENTIKKYKPKLALSIYHRREDMLSIPKYLQSLNCGYRFYLRNFWWFSVDIVLYAIPTHKHKDIR
ncbi:FkbM family methyltransferase [Helicobacter muridarum]|nr:FkbM family methyltransferase [Helicobacter muridarum]STQ87043.1 putative SAM-dependent methyltransferase [Helicobacter muridarum]